MKDFNEYKCKSCGATLSFNPGESIAVCEYCGLKQDAPNVVDDDSAVYKQALDLYYKGKYEEAFELFEELGSYQDSENFFIRCEEAIRQKKINRKNKRNAVIIFSIAAIIILTFAIRGVVKNNDSSSTNEFVFTKLKPGKQKTEEFSVNITQCVDDFPSIKSNGLDYKAHVYLGSKVDDLGSMILLLSDDNMYESQFFSIKGKNVGTYKYETVAGTKNTAKVIEVISSKEVSLDEARHPLRRTLEINETTGKLGYNITLEKVEFAEGQTRIYLKMENKGDNQITLESSKKYSYLTQENQQYSINDIPECFDYLAPGCYCEDYICLDQIKEAPFTLQLVNDYVSYTFVVGERFFGE